jgi:hypothetical protein
MILHVSVTKRDIRTGIKNSVIKCPIAIATNRALRNAKIAAKAEVSTNSLSVTSARDDNVRIGKLPSIVLATNRAISRIGPHNKAAVGIADVLITHKAEHSVETCLPKAARSFVEKFDAEGAGGVSPFTFSISLKGISLIRSDLNFQGIILSDDLNQPSLLDNYNLESIAASPLKAGVNMLMFSQEPYAKKAHQILLDLVGQDPLLLKSIEDSAAKILQLKKGFFFSPEPEIPFDHLSQHTL